MNKLIKSILMIALFLTCSFTSTNKETTGTIPQVEQMQTITYRGHTYIIYQFAKSCSGGGGEFNKGFAYVPNIRGGYGGAGMVHSPDCKCQKSKKELIDKLNLLLNDSTFIKLLEK